MGLFDDKKDPEVRKAEGLALMRKHKIVSARVVYSGGNDEGGVDEVEVTYKNGKVTNLEAVSTYDWQSRTTRSLTAKDESINALHGALTAPVYDEWYSFAGEFYVNGELLWDAEESLVTKKQSVEVQSWENEESSW